MKRGTPIPGIPTKPGTLVPKTRNTGSDKTGTPVHPEKDRQEVLKGIETMTRKARNYRDDLQALAESLIDDLLETPDEELLNEVRESKGDPQMIAREARELFERTLAEEGKAKLAAANP